MCPESYAPHASEWKIPQEVSGTHSLVLQLVLSDGALAMPRGAHSSPFPGLPVLPCTHCLLPRALLFL